MAFGLPLRPAGATAVGLPIVELITAAALVPAATGRMGAVVVIVLLSIFSAAIVRSLRAGLAPDCNCFGGVAQTEVGRGALLRNALLAAIAALVALGGQSVSAFHWIVVPAPGDRIGIFVLVAGIAGLAWFCWQLLQQNGRLLRRLEEADASGPARPEKPQLPPLEVGEPAPRFEGRDLNGEPVSLDSLLADGMPVALFFTDPGCGACELVLDSVSAVQTDRTGELNLVVISSGSIDRIERKAAEYGLESVVPQDDEGLFDAYRVRGFPALVEIAPDGSVAGPPALGADPVRAAVLGTGPARAGEREEPVR